MGTRSLRALPGNPPSLWVKPYISPSPGTWVPASATLFRLVWEQVSSDVQRAAAVWTFPLQRCGGASEARRNVVAAKSCTSNPGGFQSAEHARSGPESAPTQEGLRPTWRSAHPAPAVCSPPKEALPGRQELDTITFFAFSLIEGYISIVMDAETQKRFPSDLLLTSSTGELWRMVRIGGQPLGFGGFCPRVPAAGPRPALTAGPSPPQTSAASWPRSPSPWPLRTYRRTTSAPSTSITPWSPRRASPRSSSCSSGARRAAADSRRARRRRHPDAPAHGYPSSGSGAPSSPTVALAAAKLGLSCCSGWPARGRARGTAVLFGRRGSRESSTAPPRRQARGWRAAAARPQPRALLGLSLLAASDAFFYKK
ncbi:cytosolic arginine sensor for mTORC1 subunit 1 isoform X4 [Dromaius novaehollandiae]|uniref:cytosolic arginine sensor for mTORC1 subunit 1 isoform X4 n=1 Tax=Dromaius novaehollandiae TaxID=8790 RepID=UPI00311F1148